MFLVMFPGVAKVGNICFGRKICVREAKMFLTPGKNIFCFRAAKFVSATHVSCAAKFGNICMCKNVFATMFPSLARPLHFHKKRWAFESTKEMWKTRAAGEWFLHFSRVFLSQWNTRLRLLYMLYDIWLMGRKTILETRFSYVLYSDKTWVLDQSERAQVPIYVINGYG